MTNKLFVGGLAWATTDDSLRDFFAQAGTVVSAKVITDRVSGRSKGFGFVEMSTPEEAQAASDQLNGQELDGRQIAVNEARPQEPRQGGAGGGGGFQRRSFDRRGGGGNGGNRGGRSFDRGRSNSYSNDSYSE